MRPNVSKRTSDSTGVRRISAGIAVAAALVLFSATPGLAFNARVETQVSRFLQCKILLLTDLQRHVRVCGGGKGPIPPSLNSLSTPVEGAPAPVVVPPIIKLPPQPAKA